MKKLLFVVFCMFSFLGNAQISSRFYGNQKVFIDLKSRPLLVELLEENPKVLKKFEKPKHADALKNYKNFIKFYNQEIVLYAKKYWTLNSSIEFKNESEIEKLKDAKNNSYAILRHLRLNDIDSDFRTSMFVNTFSYTRIESNNDKPDSHSYFPSVSKLKDKLLLESDYKFALGLLQDNINYIITNKKTIDSEDYLKDMAEGNCELIKKKTLIVKESLIHEKFKKENCIKKYAGNLQIVSDDDFDKALVNKDKDKVALFSVYYELGKGSLGPVGQTFLMSYKVVIDCATGKILYLFMPRGMGVIGQNISDFMIDKDFENIKNCK